VKFLENHVDDEESVIFVDDHLNKTLASAPVQALALA
jgi:hypothetical protein